MRSRITWDIASKRAVAGIVCVSLMLFTLAACTRNKLAGTSETPTADGRTELILATDWIKGLGTMVSNFNKNNANYRIKVVNYDNTAENTITLLKTQIIAGSPPDIYAFSGNCFEDITIPLYEDLLPYLDSDPEYSHETLVPCLYKAMTRNGHLYCIPLEFDITTFIAPESVVGERQHLTMEEAEQLAAEMGPEVSVFPAWMTSEDILSHIIHFSLAKYVDYSIGTCDFQNSEFVKLLEFCKSRQAVITDDYALNQSLLVYYVLQSFNIYEGLHYYGTDYSFVGFPTQNGNGSALHIGQRFSISVSCKHKDAAWEFVRSAMSEEAQENVENFPSTRTALERQTERALSADPTKTKVWISTLDAEKFSNLLNSITMLYDGVDATIYNIISEETAVFFAGERTAEKTASLIQSRASLYLAEKS